MECDICTEHFDGAERVPKSLPCGHTACLQCLRRLPDSRCPTCRRDFKGPPEGLPTNFSLLQLLEGVRLDITPRCWCLDCRTAPSPSCWEDHDVLPVKRALRRLLQDALPQAAEQLRGLQDQCQDEQALPALTLLTGESWDVSLRGGGRELTGTLRNTEEPLTKALWLLLAERAAFTEDRVAAGAGPPPAPSAWSTRGPPPAAAPAPSAAWQTRSPPPAAAPTPSAAGPTRGPPPTSAPAPSAAAAVSGPPPAAAPAPSAAVAVRGPPPAAAPAFFAAVAARSPPPAAAPAPSAARAKSCPARELDVGWSWLRWGDEDQKKRAAALRDATGVTRLLGVHCNTDPIWALKLLKRAAASLEELSIDDPCEAHLRAVHAMPRLRRLQVKGGRIPDPADTLLPALPPGHACLQWLHARFVPCARLQSLLQAHARTLEGLQLVVGTVADDGWPWSCADLQSLLEPCGLRALRCFVFERARVSHGTFQCDKQRALVRRVLPAVEVYCDECDPAD